MELRGRPQSRLRILVVDDNHRIRELESELLQQLDYEVAVAANAAEASQLLHASDWDLLMTDIHLPGASNGVELARSAKKRSPRLKTLIVGGDVDQYTRRDFEGIADATLKKPFRINELQHKIAALIGPARTQR